ncbi:MAG: PEP-CTERM sorting domain-containing protein [Casimicrobiaceae bacterium]|jgi:hypothetical protein
MRRAKSFAYVSAMAAVLCTAAQIHAAVIRVPIGSFLPATGLITFSEFTVGTVNPVYTPATYGGGAGLPTVTFDGFFTGQALGTVGTCPAGAAVTGCVVGAPTNPVALDAASPNTVITNDLVTPTSPVLSGSPTFNGPISIFFSTDVYGVGLTGGFFDAIGGTSITAFNRQGVNLGQVTNTGLGIEFLGLVTDTGLAQIAGLQFSLVGAEPFGFGIDNVRFGLPGQVTPPLPEPSVLALLAIGALGLCLTRRKR